MPSYIADTKYTASALARRATYRKRKRPSAPTRMESSGPAVSEATRWIVTHTPPTGASAVEPRAHHAPIDGARPGRARGAACLRRATSAQPCATRSEPTRAARSRKKGGRFARPPPPRYRAHTQRRAHKLNLPKSSGRIFSRYSLSCSAVMSRGSSGIDRRVLVLVLATPSTLRILHLDRGEQRLLREDRRREPQRDRNAVRRPRVDVEDIFAAQQMQLREVRVVLHLRDLHALAAPRPSR